MRAGSAQQTLREKNARAWWQVVYFHNNQYARVTRHPLSEIRTAPPVHLLPAIQELYAEIPLKLEEDLMDPTKSQGWYWLLLSGRIYLVTPEPSVLYNENISDLLKVYIDRTTKLDRPGLEPGTYSSA